MSKEERFIYFGIDILQEKYNKGGLNKDVVNCSLDAEKICQIIEEIKEQKNEVNNTYTANESGNLSVIVYDETDKGIPAQIKLFPLLEDESAQNYNPVNGVINVIRNMTDDVGKAEMELPIGRYYAEITKGSEYEVLKSEIQIENNGFTKKLYKLIRFVDLSTSNYYAGDLHHHSIYSSPVYGGTDDVTETPELVSNSMRAMGLSFGALSDHHNIFNHEAWKRVKTDDFLPILSKEISTSNGHVMSLGVTQDVIYQIPKEEDRTNLYLREEFIRITKEIKAAGGMAQLNHPRDRSVSNSWNPDFYDMITIFDTLELWNGATPMIEGTGNDQTFQLWRQLLEENKFIPATTGSDTHNIRINDYHRIFKDMVALKHHIKQFDETNYFKKKYGAELETYLKICEEVLPTLEKWAETSLGTGCVRTYVKTDGKQSYEKIIKALKKGNSFLTNGPILIPTIKGAGAGETVIIGEKEKVTLDIQILSNRKLSNLYYMVNGHRCVKKKLKGSNTKNTLNYYDYSMQEELELEDVKWVTCVVEQDCTNMAISNPIFLTR